MSHWYFIRIEECALCGKRKVYRHIMRDVPRPMLWQDRHETTLVYDFCQD